jgi:lipopolysaccharide export system permease protein
MSIIQKYLTKEIVKQFGIVLIAVICIYVIVDFFEKSDNFVKAGLSLSKTLVFFLLNIPFIISQITPVGILLSVIILFSLMRKNNEILALQSSGISIYSLLIPVVALGLAGSILLFFFSDIVVPITTVKANRIWLKDVKKKSLVTSLEKNIWIKSDDRITHIKYYNPKNKTVHGVTINFFDRDFRLIRKIDASKGFYKDEKWIVHEVMEQKRNETTSVFDISFHDRLPVVLDFVPEDLKRIIKKPTEMSFKELLTYIRKVETEGYDATVYRVDLYAKPAYAFICVIMCIIGMGLAVRQQRQRQQGIFFNISYGIIAAFFYWIFYSFCLSLGYGEMLPPIIAAWTANLVFLCMGLLILVNAE